MYSLFHRLTLGCMKSHRYSHKVLEKHSSNRNQTINMNDFCDLHLHIEDNTVYVVCIIYSCKLRRYPSISELEFGNSFVS